MEDLLMWGLALLGLGVLLLVAEMFLPSGGILSIVSALCAVAGIIVLFIHDRAWGVAGLLSVLVMGPMAGVFLIKVWPHTPVGKAIFGTPSEDEVQKQQLAEEQEKMRWASMVGKEGTVLTDLRPVGQVDIDGHRHEAICETTLVRAGQKVRVTHASPMQIKVRPVA